MSDDSATYLYGLVRSTRAPACARAPGGLPGAARPRLLDAGKGVWLIVATVPRQRYGEEALSKGLQDLNWVSDCAIAHEAVVEHFLAVRGGKSGRPPAMVPMKLFTLFLSDERALRHIERRRRAVDRLLDRIAGRLEWGVRVSLDEKKALVRAERAAARVAPATSGAGFLLRKKTLHETSRKLSAEALGHADELFRALSAHADDARRRPALESQAGARLLLDAAFLVPLGRATRFRGAVKTLAARLGKDGFEVTLSGPWPPYNFVADGT